MQAIIMEQCGGPEVLRLTDVPIPEITASQIRVRLHAAGVNPVDTKLRRNGTYFPADMPAILGCDGAGIVDAVGSEVTRFQPGDAVYYCYGGLGKKGTGNYAAYAIVEEAFAARKPDCLDFVEAAAAPLVLITAWESLFDRAHLATGDRVLIHAGAGGVGHVAVQLARITGTEIATTVSSDEKAAFVTGLGADRAINYRQEDFAQSVLDWTNGMGVDVAFDTVGGDVFNKTIPAVRFYGRLVTILQAPADADWKAARLRNMTICQELMLSPQVYGLEHAARHHGDILERCGRWFEEGRLNIHVAQCLGLAEAARAHEHIECGGMTGKIVLKIDGD